MWKEFIIFILSLRNFLEGFVIIIILFFFFVFVDEDFLWWLVFDYSGWRCFYYFVEDLG